MSAELAVRWIRLAAERVADRRIWLTELDAAIGDGDHGINLDRGFATLVARLDAGDLPIDDPGAFLMAVGRTITGTVGGAAGALYGRAFLRAGGRLGAPAAAPTGGRRAPDVAGALGDAVEGIAALGHARPGEKTMLDALAPAAATLRRALESGATLAVAARQAAALAEAGAQATIPLLATKGRASYLGERSIGHLDPGAASSALLLAALADAAADD